MGSKLINSQFIDVVDVIEVECGRTLKITELLGIDENETCLSNFHFYTLHACIALSNVPCIEMKL